MSTHIPVLKKEVLEFLNPKHNENFIDCTVGEGGHTEAILEKIGPAGKVLGIDLDQEQIKNCRENVKSERLILKNDSYANLLKIAEENRFGAVSGILADLGMSSVQLEKSKKGFSFQEDQPLDMRYSTESELTAEEIVNEWPEEKIEEILREYGEEKFSKKIARNIVSQRKQSRIKTTFELAEIIKDATPPIYWRGRIHYATRTFQALRIAVNGELDNLEKVLPQIVSILEPGGRIAIISFHSLEDRIVKNFLRDKQKEGIIKILTKSPVTAGPEELRSNPRSRSAKLRAAVKI